MHQIAFLRPDSSAGERAADEARRHTISGWMGGGGRIKRKGLEIIHRGVELILATLAFIIVPGRE